MNKRTKAITGLFLGVCVLGLAIRAFILDWQVALIMYGALCLEKVAQKYLDSKPTNE